MRLRWTPPARDHLAEIHSYIAKDNPAAARRVIGQVRKDADLLKDNPGMGRPGRIEGTRELVVSRFPYIIVYRPAAPDEVHIAAVIHSSRLWPEKIP
ncbi:MAG: type II toxin-antitoxin system RelE/ParE family toxin [Rhodocyclales bacterium]|nr:type II toxin-antitoxin system RelE/ParE family toxin [Rhodocyclales bacterium]